MSHDRRTCAVCKAQEEEHKKLPNPTGMMLMSFFPCANFTCKKCQASCAGACKIDDVMNRKSCARPCSHCNHVCHDNAPKCKICWRAPACCTNFCNPGCVLPCEKCSHICGTNEHCAYCLRVVEKQPCPPSPEECAKICGDSKVMKLLLGGRHYWTMLTLGLLKKPIQYPIVDDAAMLKAMIVELTACRGEGLRLAAKCDEIRLRASGEISQTNIELQFYAQKRDKLISAIQAKCDALGLKLKIDLEKKFEL